MADDGSYHMVAFSYSADETAGDAEREKKGEPPNPGTLKDHADHVPVTDGCTSSEPQKPSVPELVTPSLLPLRLHLV